MSPSRGIIFFTLFNIFLKNIQKNWEKQYNECPWYPPPWLVSSHFCHICFIYYIKISVCFLLFVFVFLLNQFRIVFVALALWTYFNVVFLTLIMRTLVCMTLIPLSHLENTNFLILFNSSCLNLPSCPKNLKQISEPVSVQHLRVAFDYSWISYVSSLLIHKFT